MKLKAFARDGELWLGEDDKGKTIHFRVLDGETETKIKMSGCEFVEVPSKYIRIVKINKKEGVSKLWKK